MKRNSNRNNLFLFFFRLIYFFIGINILFTTFLKIITEESNNYNLKSRIYLDVFSTGLDKKTSI